MKVIPFTAIDTICQDFNFYPLEGGGEIILAAELARLSPEQGWPFLVNPGETYLVTHLWPCDAGLVHPTYSLATYAATV